MSKPNYNSDSLHLNTMIVRRSNRHLIDIAYIVFDSAKVNVVCGPRRNYMEFPIKKTNDHRGNLVVEIDIEFLVRLLVYVATCKCWVLCSYLRYSE